MIAVQSRHDRVAIELRSGRSLPRQMPAVRSGYVDDRDHTWKLSHDREQHFALIDRPAFDGDCRIKVSQNASRVLL